MLRVLFLLSSVLYAQSVEEWIRTAKQNDPESQIKATDALVDHYVPGYMKSGLGGAISKAGTSVKGKFTDTNTQVVDAWVQVRPDVIEAIGQVASGGSSYLARANAARALGILRAKAALPQLGDALKSGDKVTQYEALIAIQKIRDIAAAPMVRPLLMSGDERVQIAALETAGVLNDKSSVAEIRKALENSRNVKVRRTAVTALGMIADPASRPVFELYFNDKDDNLRAASAEGFGRMRQASDLDRINKAFAEEKKTGPKMSQAFAAVLLGRRELGSGTPLSYLIEQLDSRFYGDTARPFLVEITRDQAIRQSIYNVVPTANRKEKIGIAQVLAVSGGKDSLPVVEQLSNDPDTAVAAEGIKALRTLKSRLG
ncbi:MAG: HEAT repeat domain-containing protein [Acidobacteria bacterium]|nr:HEAT repeat domain-containing protein [Acidobacteriota bacterium]